ncbi:MAG TPA: sodium:proton antiporter [Gammaproteobacteria bacterium]|nr:sodium:proton antiporter [Gammaproteobacteria bacterium]HIL96719.1 sodium:proton antiporter [Pseudomonadales bacterium]
MTETYITFSVFALFAFAYSLIAGRLEKTIISGPIVFTFCGYLLGPQVFGVFEYQYNAESLRLIAELTLGVILFVDASLADLGVLRKSSAIPKRMLLIGLPLVLLLGYGVGELIFTQMSWVYVALLATMLAPTDAALGKPVIANETVPANIRQGLNFESGLNDGICVPILLVFLAIATGEAGESRPIALVLSLVAQEIGIGALVGVGLTLLGGSLMRICHERGWITSIWMQLLIPSLAIACFTLAQALHGSGFIASFIGGLVLNRMGSSKIHELTLPAEGVGEMLAMLTWLFFGIAVVGQFASSMSWEILLYAILSLTLIRILPIFVSLTGLGLDWQTKLFLGWFGPRGLASIVFVIIFVQASLPGVEVIVMTVSATVVMSVLAHGVTANPLARIYVNRKTKI